MPGKLKHPALERNPSALSIERIISYADNLERVLDNLKEGVIAHDLNRRIFFFNAAAERITGYDRSEVMGKDCHEAMGGPFCGSRCHFCGSHSMTGDSSEYSTYIRTKEGEYRCVEMCVTAMHLENGEKIGVLASFQDGTNCVNLQLKAEKIHGFGEIIGQDPRMLEIFQQIRNVARYDYPVHIFGETGTGKELVASAVHFESSRKNGPFVPINCGALPEGLIESELFGHVKGAFTGAIRDKKGRFELADGGTVFLDEVAELSKPMQAKLLRFLQEGEFEKVGGEKTISVNVRVSSATNKNLKREVAENRFRDDLYYRLNVIPIHLPPLRERKTDIPLLIRHFISQAEKRHNQPCEGVSSEAMSRLLAYHWPGNIRELQNAIQYAIVVSHNHRIEVMDLPLEIQIAGECRLRSEPPRRQKLDTPSVIEALRRAGSNKSKAAHFLGVGRATLYRFLKENPEICPDST